MFKLILSILAIYLAVRLFQQKLNEKKEALNKQQEGGRIIEGEVVKDENESNQGDKQ